MALCALGLCLSQTGTQITQDDNTRKQPLSDASVKIDGSTSWRSAVDSVVFDWSQVHLNWLVLLVLVILRIWLANAKRSLWRWWRNIFAERLSGCAELHMVRLIEPLSLHVLPILGKTWFFLLVDVFSTLFLNCFWAARSCSDVWLSFRSFGGTGTTDDNPWKQPRWNKQCGLEWFDYLMACASTNQRVISLTFVLWRYYSICPLCSLQQKILHNSCLRSLWSTH